MVEHKIDPNNNALILLEQKRFIKGMAIGIFMAIPLWCVTLYGLNYLFA